MRHSIIFGIGTFTLVSLFFVVGLALFPLTTHAASRTLYVDKDNACPGAGSTTDPYCTIGRAFDAVTAGDTIRIRNTAAPYDEQAKVTSSTQSGTASNPIVVEPDIGHNPVIRYTGNGVYGAAIWLQDVDYWTIRNLNFDGTGIQTSRFAVTVHAKSRDVTGNSVTGNTFRNWGGSESNTGNNTTVNIDNEPGSHENPQQFSAQNTVVKGNTFVGNRGNAIGLTRTQDTRVEDNDISGQKCSSRIGISQIDEVGIGIGGRFPMPANPDLRAYIANNRIHDFDPPENCGLGRPILVGIWADVDADNGIAENNRVYNIGRDDDIKNGWNAQGIGIMIELQCDNWIVRNNTIYNTGIEGIRNGNDQSSADPVFNGDAVNNQYLNNTIYRGGVQGINIRNGAKVTVKNNIVVDSSISQITMGSLALADGGHTINYNLYWGKTGSGKVGRWNDFTDRNFTSWKSACSGCDANSRNVNPLFVNTVIGSENFALQTGSPALGAGEGGATLGAPQSRTAPPSSPSPPPQLPTPPEPPSPTLPSPILCTQVHRPVCGVDGKTYGNRCEAEEQHKVRVSYEGVCKKSNHPPAPRVPYTQDLYIGMRHAAVERLQKDLSSDPSIYPEKLITGYFGSLTQKAVKRFQAKHGIRQTGYVGPLTRARLNQLYRD